MEQRVEKILHPLGFEAGSDYCLRYTLGLARKHQAKLVLLHIINRSRPSVNLLFNLTLSAEEKEKFRNSQRDYAARRIRFDVDRLCLHDFGLDAKIDEILEAIIIEEGWPGDVIVAKAREYGCDAICIGTPDRCRGRRSALRKTVTHVLRHVDMPVFVIPSPRQT